MTEKKAPDWTRIEAEYRAGIKPLRQLGEEHGITHAAISKKAKQNGWERDLSERIRQQAEAKVARAVVTAEVAAARVATEKEVVDANAELQYRVRMEHRQDIASTRELFKALLAEVKGVTLDLEVFEELRGALVQIKASEGRGGVDVGELVQRIGDSITRLTNVGSRIDHARKLTETLERLVRMEREAFGIKDEASGEGGIEDLLRRIATAPSAD